MVVDKTRLTEVFLQCFDFIEPVDDFSCYFRISENWVPFLKAIAIVNLLYCCISLVLVFHHYQKLTDLGLIYFLLEFTIVIILVSVELKTVAKLGKLN